MIVRDLDLDVLHEQFVSATPFRHVVIEDFLRPELADAVVADCRAASNLVDGAVTFKTVNERLKFQINDSERFPESVGRLHGELNSPDFRDIVSRITGIPHLLEDPVIHGGGIHMTAPGGRLDVHVDFNFAPEIMAYRRLNLIVFLNPQWSAEWGGELELWDAEVQTCHASLLPVHNRCVIFETHQTSYHGVTRVTCPPGEFRRSFSCYYYTKECPREEGVELHGTIFQARPAERLKKYVLMPAERLKRRIAFALRQRFLKTPPPAKLDSGTEEDTSGE